jgi:hypothetical protein
MRGSGCFIMANAPIGPMKEDGKRFLYHENGTSKKMPYCVDGYAETWLTV